MFHIRSGSTYRTNKRLRLKYAHFLAFHQWLASRSVRSSGRAVGGTSFATVCRKREHHPMTTGCALREAASSNYNYQHFCVLRIRASGRTNVACLYAFNTICSISPASSLVSLTRPCPMVKSRGKVASTILSKSVRFSPDLKRKTRQIARRHCRPAKIEDASLVFKSCTVMGIKAGHLSGKS